MGFIVIFLEPKCTPVESTRGSGPVGWDHIFVQNCTLLEDSLLQFLCDYRAALMLSLGLGLGLKTNFFGLGLGLGRLPISVDCTFC